jgi:hypothetical protein
MAEITGTVRCLSISEVVAFTTIDETSGGSETLILWFAPGTGGGIPQTLTAFTRVLHSMWVSQLREAHTNNLTVTIIHPNDSAEINSVRLGTF